MKYVVYRTTNKITGRYYVGVKKTWNTLNLKEYYGSGILIKNAVNKYGEDNFKRDIIAVYEGDVIGKTFAYSLEASLVNNSTIYPKNPMSYNLREGGFGGYSGLSQRARDKLRQRCIETPLHRGHKHSEETKKLLSQQRKGKRMGKDNPFYGKKHSEEEKYRQRKSKGTAIKIDGVLYHSKNEFHKKYKMDCRTINKRLQDPEYPNYQYVDKE